MQNAKMTLYVLYSDDEQAKSWAFKKKWEKNDRDQEDAVLKKNNTIQTQTLVLIVWKVYSSRSWWWTGAGSEARFVNIKLM